VAADDLLTPAENQSREQKEDQEEGELDNDLKALPPRMVQTLLDLVAYRRGNGPWPEGAGSDGF
jgi:hypothetical protein